MRTYIASGNVVFQSDRPEAEIKAKLEAALMKIPAASAGTVRNMNAIAKLAGMAAVL